jgi:uridylate kinase
VSTTTPVIYKVSGESLSEVENGTFTPLSDQRFSFVADELKLLVDAGYVSCVVVGGGNIFRGTGRSGFPIDPKKADRAGMGATKVNADLLEAFLDSKGIDAVVRTRGDLGGVPWDSEEARGLLGQGVIVILAGGMGEPGMSSDFPAVFHASEVGASAVLVAKHGIDAVYTDDPRTVRTATRLEKTTCSEVLRNRLQFMDATAIEQARRSGTALFVFSATQRAGGLNAVRRGRSGTVVLPE